MSVCCPQCDSWAEPTEHARPITEEERRRYPHMRNPQDGSNPDMTITCRCPNGHEGLLALPTQSDSLRRTCECCGNPIYGARCPTC